MDVVAQPRSVLHFLAARAYRFHKVGSPGPPSRPRISIGPRSLQAGSVGTSRHRWRRTRSEAIRNLLPLLCFQLFALAISCEPVQQIRAETLGEFRSLSAVTEPVDSGSIDYGLLAEAIYHETNSRRLEHDLETLDHMASLDMAACLHADAMVDGGFFAHRNPNDQRIETPADRVRAQGLEIGFVAENIGEVFVLQYESGEQVYVRQEDGRTVFSEEPGGEPLERRSYLEVAEALLDSWMSSPGHRRNILAREPDYFGAGCRFSPSGEPSMPMLTCVQLFFSPRGGRL